MSALRVSILAAVADRPLGPFVKSPDNPIAGTDLVVGYPGSGHAADAGRSRA